MKFRFASYAAIAVVMLTVSCRNSDRPAAAEYTGYGPPPLELLGPNYNMKWGRPETLASLKEAAAMPAPPRTADGHPNLTGYWGRAIEEPAPLTPDASGKINLGFENLDTLDKKNLVPYANKLANLDAEVAAGRRPSYIRDEDKAKAKDLMTRQNRMDPSIHCQPRGVPRVHQPDEIIQSPNEIIFLYSGSENWLPAYRVIPTDGTQHDKDADPLPNGDSIGHWDGDTLVVDVTNLSDDTWLEKDGLIHDDNLHVVERLTRLGNTLQYQVNIEDPTMFTKPWIPQPYAVKLRPGHVTEGAACSERSSAHEVNDNRYF